MSLALWTDRLALHACACQRVISILSGAAKVVFRALLDIVEKGLLEIGEAVAFGIVSLFDAFDGRTGAAGTPSIGHGNGGGHRHVDRIVATAPAARLHLRGPLLLPLPHKAAVVDVSEDFKVVASGKILIDALLLLAHHFREVPRVGRAILDSLGVRQAQALLVARGIRGSLAIRVGNASLRVPSAHGQRTGQAPIL